VQTLITIPSQYNIKYFFVAFLLDIAVNQACARLPAQHMAIAVYAINTTSKPTEIEKIEK